MAICSFIKFLDTQAMFQCQGHCRNKTVSVLLRSLYFYEETINRGLSWGVAAMSGLCRDFQWVTERGLAAEPRWKSSLGGDDIHSRRGMTGSGHMCADCCEEHVRWGDSSHKSLRWEIAWRVWETEMKAILPKLCVGRGKQWELLKGK